MQDCKVNILGTEWNIIFQTIEQDKAFADCDGYCDPTVKKIHVRLYTDEEVKEQKFGYESKMCIRDSINSIILYNRNMTDWLRCRHSIISNSYITNLFSRLKLLV